MGRHTSSRKRSASVGTVVTLILGFLIASPVYGQVVGGTFSGTVMDVSGGVIPNANITIKNSATMVTRNAMTDSAGFYTAPNLIPGNYEISASAPNFATEVQRDITLTVGASQVLNITLQVGLVSQTIEITGAAPAVQLATSDLSAVVNATTVRELPLNGRSWTDLAALQPGVAAIQTQVSFATGADRGNRGFGAQSTISGARPQQNNYRLDGISINDYANGAPGSVLGGNLGVDAIQEFSVITSNYSAEYGKASGGVFNAVTRSGTNEFHGTAYEFLRDSALDAPNFFDVGGIPPFKRNQFGAAAGAPIRKDRTFIFGDYEGIRQSEGFTQLITVPSLAARSGNLSSGTVTVDPSVQKYLPLYPLPNAGILAPGDVGLFRFVTQQVVNENYFTIRLDHRFSEKDAVHATELYDDTSYTDPDSFNDVLLGNQTKRQMVIVEETHTFNPRLVNSVRFGFNRDAVAANQSIKALNPLAADSTLGGNPGTSASMVSVTGLSLFPGGLGAASTSFFYWNSFQAYDDAFLTRGNHSLKFGVAVERMQLNDQLLSNANGSFTFGSLAKFLTNVPTRYDSGDLVNLAVNGLRQTIFGAYVQDDWRWHPNLTINVGLRYEMATVPTDVHDHLATLHTLTDPAVTLGSPLFKNPTLLNFEPRVGFAWDPFHDGKTSVRGGFGIFDVLPLTYQFNLQAAFTTPFFHQLRASNLPPGSFFAGASPLLSTRALRATYFQQDPPRNYVEQWNLNVQRELSPSLTAVVGYVGSHGVHQSFPNNDFDLVLPTQTAAGLLWPNPVGSGNLLNPNFGSIRGQINSSSSFYDALELQLTKRMSHGIQAQASYTWGKSIDTSSASLAGDAFANSISSLPWYTGTGLNRGPSDFNVGHILVINGTWVIPQIKSLTGPAGYVANGWQLGGIFKASDGVPFTPLFGPDGDPLGTKSGEPDVPNRLGGSGCATLTNPGNPNNYIKTQCFAIPTAPSAAFWTANCDPAFGTITNLRCFNLRGNAGRNILIGPGISNLDFSVFKNNYIHRVSENFNVQFRTEFFNILNRANFNVPAANNSIFDSSGAAVSTAGLVTSTSTSAREIQFGLKIIW